MTIRNTESGNLLSFAEMFQLRTTRNFLLNQFMSDHHLELIPNSSLTIANAVDDVFHLSDGKRISTEEDLELMDRYKTLLAEFNIPIAKKMTPLAISFLREHQHLL